MNHKTKIPKTIHYCWFGKNKMPKNILECLDTWEKILPEYKKVCWNEDNFDIHSNKFVEEAYNAKKWAFVADYVRLYALYHHGGIYLDTDVKVLKPLDSFLNHKVFASYENKLQLNFIATGLIGAIRNHGFFKKWLDYYEDKHFILPPGEYDLTTNVCIITNIAEKEYSFKGNGKYQVFDDDIHIYPFDFFSCYNGEQDYGFKNTCEITDNTYAVHLFASSWLPAKVKRRRKIQNIIGYDNYCKIQKFLKIQKKIRAIIGEDRYYKIKFFLRLKDTR